MIGAMHLLRTFIFSSFFLLVATPCLARNDVLANSIKVEQAWANPLPASAKVGGAFMTIGNSGKLADKLIAAESPIASSIELHTHTLTDGVMKMRAIAEIPIPASESVTLKPGALHVMLFGLKQPLVAHEKFPLTLIFEKAGKVAVEVHVRERTGAASAHSHMNHQH